MFTQTQYYILLNTNKANDIEYCYFTAYGILNVTTYYAAPFLNTVITKMDFRLHLKTTTI